MLYKIYLYNIRQGIKDYRNVCNHILWWLEYYDCNECKKIKENLKNFEDKKIQLKKPTTIGQVRKILLNRFYDYTIPNYLKKTIITGNSTDGEREIQRILNLFKVLAKIPDDTYCFLYDRLEGLGWTRCEADMWYFNIFDYVPVLKVPLDPSFEVPIHLEIRERFYYKTYQGKIYFAYKIPMEIIRSLFLPFSLILIEGKKFNYKFDYFITTGELIAIDFEKLKKALPNKKGE